MSKIYKIGTLMMATAIVAGLWSCADDAITEPTTPDNNSSIKVGKGEVLLTMGLTTPSTRSYTDDSGQSSGDKNQTDGTQFEGGKDMENTIGDDFSVAFFIKDGDWKEILTRNSGENNNKIEQGPLRAMVTVTLEELMTLASGEDGKVRILLTVNGGGTASAISEAGALGFGSNMEAIPLGKFNSHVLPMASHDWFEVDFSGLKSCTSVTEVNEYLLENNLITTTDREISLSRERVTETAELPGSLDLERSIARVDFRPKNWGPTTRIDEQIYQVGEIPNLYAKMYSLQVFNVAPSSYVYRHTAKGNDKEAEPTGATDTNVLFGKENDNENFGDDPDELEDGQSATAFTWIRDVDWGGKEDNITTNVSKYGFYNEFKRLRDAGREWTGPVAVNKTLNPADPTTHYFLNQMTKSDDAPVYYVHSVSGTDDSGVTTTNNYGTLNLYDLDYFSNNIYLNNNLSGNYLPLYYMSENTMPSTETMINGLSTGVAFKLIISKKDGTPLTNEDFYTGLKVEYDHKMQELVDRIAELKDLETPSEEETTELEQKEAEYNGLKDKVVGSLTQAKKTETTYYDNWYVLKIGSQSVYAEKVTLPNDGEGYAITYYYYFNHNKLKNHELGVTDPMQYAVVRNNIYKICVTALNGLPDPYEPGKPDEPIENYIDIETAILSWKRLDQNVEL